MAPFTKGKVGFRFRRIANPELGPVIVISLKRILKHGFSRRVQRLLLAGSEICYILVEENTLLTYKKVAMAR